MSKGHNLVCVLCTQYHLKAFDYIDFVISKLFILSYTSKKGCIFSKSMI